MRRTPLQGLLWGDKIGLYTERGQIFGLHKWGDSDIAAA